MITKNSKFFFGFLFSIVTISCLCFFQKYIIKENFFVFLEESSIPEISLQPSFVRDVYTEDFFKNKSGVFLWKQ